MSTGDVRQRQIQQKGRVDVPDDIWDSLGLEYGDSILVYEDDGRVQIRPASVEELR